MSLTMSRFYVVVLLVWFGPTSLLGAENEAARTNASRADRTSNGDSNSAIGAGAHPNQTVVPAPDELLENNAWYSDYARAMKAAQAEEKMMFIWFRPALGGRTAERFDLTSPNYRKTRELLRGYVAVQLRTDARITVQGEEIRVMDHASFQELHGQPGVAILDFQNKDAEHYGHVVTAIPFAPGRFYTFRPEHLPVLLDLPKGTLTQRTMVFAVRIHPEAPASTKGDVDPMLMDEAKSHSRHQARIHRQGHHQWERRFPRLSRLLPFGLHAQEIVAESWPHESLVDAAVDCVDSWRHSSAHWSAVRSRQPRFGYDMQRGSNGVWYATGLFGNRY